MLRFLIFSLSIWQAFLLTCNDNEKLDPYSGTLATEVCKPCNSHQKSCASSIECFSGYYLQNDVCTSEIEKPAHCMHTDASSICVECDDGYWLNNEKNCVAKSSQYLEKCKQWDEPAASETCEIPKNGYGYVSNAFITCFSYCILCDSTSSCSECVDGYYLNTEKNKCLKTEGNCLEWKNATDEECHSCESGYTAKQNICYNSKCKCADGKVASYPDCNTDCSTNCRVCSASDVCTECNVQFYLIAETKACGACPSNCDQCSSDAACSQCADGYYKTDGNLCEKCADNCTTCTSDSACQTCDSTTTLYSGLCSAVVDNCQSSTDGTNCDACKSGYFKVSVTECTSCGSNCTTCESATECSVCKDGYYLTDAKACSQCNSTLNCKTCSSADSCDTCIDNYMFHLIDKTKKKCVSCLDTAISKFQKMECEDNQWAQFPWNCTDLTGNCLITESSFINSELQYDIQICSFCETGYKLVDYACSKCEIENCANCDEATDRCETCKTGYYNENKLGCKACMTNCDQCTNATICLDCKTGFAFNNDLTECVECQDEHCEECSAETVCVKCETSYFLNSTNHCQECQSTCQECYNDHQCFQCKDTYFIKDYGCFSCIENCLKCENEGTCKTCKDGFIANTAKTVCMNETLCKGNNPNCKTCSVLDTVECYECQDEYYIEEKLCKPCLDNCKTCTDNEKCTACNDNYELNADNTQCLKKTTDEASCFSLIQGCIQCSASNLLKCAFCASGSAPTSLGQCICSAGYYLISGQCVKQNSLTVDFDSLSSTTLETLQTYIEQATYGSDKANRTEKVLKQIKSQVSTIEEETAAKAAGLLLALSQTTTNLQAQNYYKDILSSICKTKGLSNTVYYQSMAAADSFYPISNQTMREDVYKSGFTDCINNYLTKASPEDIQLIQFANSQLLVKEMDIQANSNEKTAFEFTNTEIIATAELKDYLGEQSATKKYYMVAQSINNDANPYKYTQNQSQVILFESKIMTVNIMSKETETDESAPTLIDIDLKDKSFNITFDFEGTKCGSYNEDKLLWQFDGNATEKTCMFNHTTAFVIYQQPQEVDQANNANTIGFVWLLLLLFVLF